MGLRPLEACAPSVEGKPFYSFRSEILHVSAAERLVGKGENDLNTALQQRHHHRRLQFILTFFYYYFIIFF